MDRLRSALEEKYVLLDLPAGSLDEVFHAVLVLLEQRGIVAARRVPEGLAALVEREQLGSTAIGHAVAVPHAYVDCFERQVLVFVRLDRAINLGAPDGIPTRFVVLLLGPPDAAAGHIDTLMHTARLMSDEEFRYDARRARDHLELGTALARFRERTSVPPRRVAPRVSDGLKWSGKLFGGLMGDIRRRAPYYLSDFRDGLHLKCMGSTLFLFFACLAPCVTFGGVMAAKTNFAIGAVEYLVATCAGGLIYGLLSGQPLVLIGGTGPILVFITILFELCRQLGLPFLPTYAWVGLWTAGFVMALAAVDASCLMRYFTRFTEEIFSGMIALIFIYEAIRSLAEIFRNLDVEKHHDTALLSLLLALGTFYIAMSLSRMRRSHYLRGWMREFLADFGPTIALAAMALVAVRLHEVSLPVLDAPERLATTSGRPWLVDIWAAPTWVRLAAAGPALLGAVLVFLDQNITARLVNSRDHRLQKGEAYHLDLAVVGLLAGACSLCGMPWLVAATVRSLNHVRSLATSEEVVRADGVTSERIIHVRENRVTALGVHLLIGAALMLLPWLKMIPLATLYGLFLYMGVITLTGNQFVNRLSLWIKDPDLYPATHYIRQVPIRAVHLFTMVQLGCLAVLWFVKSSSAGILFPLFIAALAPMRGLLSRFFSAEHLESLDAEEEPEEEVETFF